MQKLNPKRAMKLLVSHGFANPTDAAHVGFSKGEYEPLRRLALLLG
jgi:hypothetical protein